MSTLISLELRWFFRGDLSTAITNWFHHSLPGKQISPPDTREDLYLYQPQCEHVGTKLRIKKAGVPYSLEVKWREFARPYTGPHGMAGQLERWLKWDWEDPNGPAREEIDKRSHPSGPWLMVAKTRLQRKYAWEGTALAAVPPKEMVSLGAAVEITSLSVRNLRYATVLVETFAPDTDGQLKILDAALNELCREFPRPLPTRDQSFGYPRWLSQLDFA